MKVALSFVPAIAALSVSAADDVFDRIPPGSGGRQLRGGGGDPRSRQQQSKAPGGGGGRSLAIESLFKWNPRPASGAVKRIVGGSDVSSAASYPWYAALEDLGTGSRCGAVLIGPGFAATAAHCVGSGVAERYEVEVGAYCRLDDRDDNCGSPSEFISVRDVYMYPGRTDGMENDIALMRLSRASFLPYVAPDNGTISAAFTGGEPLTAVGFGKTSNLDDVPPPVYLQYVVLDYVTNPDCAAAYHELDAAVGEDMLCSYRYGADTCNGDSGGPVVHQRSDGSPVLVGTVSWGHRKCATGYPGVGARVGYHYVWIESVVCADDLNSTVPKPDWCPWGTGAETTAPTTAGNASATHPTTTTSATTTTTSAPTSSIHTDEANKHKCHDEETNVFLVQYRYMMCLELATEHSDTIIGRICHYTEAQSECPATCEYDCKDAWG